MASFSPQLSFAKLMLIVATVLTSVVWAQAPVTPPTSSEATRPAAPEKSSLELDMLRERLRDDKAQLVFTQAKLKNLIQQRNAWLSTLRPATLNQSLVNRAVFELQLAEIEVEKIALDITSTEQNITLLEQNQRELEKQLLSFGAAKEKEDGELFKMMQWRVELGKQKLATQTTRLQVLHSLQTTAAQVVVLEKEWVTVVEEEVRKTQITQLQRSRVEKEALLEKEKKRWEDDLSMLRRQLTTQSKAGELRSENEIILQDQIFEAEENIQLINIRFTLNRIDIAKKMLVGYNDLRAGRKYADANRHIDRLGLELSSLKDFIHDKQALLEKQSKIVQQGEKNRVLSTKYTTQELSIINHLYSEYEQAKYQAERLEKSVIAFRDSFLTSGGETWSYRQTLPTTTLEWQILFENLWVVPELTAHTLSGLYHQFTHKMLKATPTKWIFLILIEAAIVFFGLQLYRYLGKVLSQSETRLLNFSKNTARMIMQLVYRNIWGLVVWGGLLSALMIARLGPGHLAVPLSLALVWFMFKVTLDFFKLILVKNVLDFSSPNARLYRRLRWILSLSGIVTALTMLSHELPIGTEVTASYDRMFMLVLLAVALPLLRHWRMLPDLVLPYLSEKTYVRRTIYALGFLIPLAICSNAIIGLLGYTHLAWMIGAAEANILFVGTLFLLVKGVLDDLIQYACEFCIRSFTNGWVWTEALIKPFQKLLNILLILAAFAALVLLYGWDQASPVTQKIIDWTTKSIFSIKTLNISLLNIFLFVILIGVIRWAARWSREFSYRWLFAQAKDAGVRNSLSIFTQYTTVIVGGLIILWVLGIDVTTLTVVAGALAVGIGFGLQNIANNLVSGILLLIERPIRVGDLITIANYEGTVTHIGMRATTVKTGDNTEVIIPNAEAVSQSFINWTHHDTIVRNHLSLRVGFYEDPHKVSALIFEVVSRHHAVVSEPKVEVFLREFGESALLFEVRYYVDLSQSDFRTRIQSEILLALWDRLKAEGIELPYPTQNTVVQNIPRGE